MAWLETAFIGLIGLFVLGLAALGLIHDGYPAKVAGFPAAVALAVALLCAVLLMRQWRDSRRNARRRDAISTSGEKPSGSAGTPAWKAVGWVMLAAPCLYAFGLIAGLCVYAALYLGVHRQGWRATGAITLATGAALYGLLVAYLQAPLPGPLFGFGG